MKELKTAACYIRVSTDKQEELSPASQLKEIKKWAKENGYILTSEYIFMEHEGVSGRSADKRQEFQRMIAIAKTKPKPFDAIILWKFSRFARNQEEATFYKGLLRKKLGIDVISISEPILEGMFGRLIEMIIEWFDEYYSVNLAGEVMRGMIEKAQRGGYQNTPPFGYTPNKDTGVPDIVPEQAQVVRIIFDMAADMTNSYYDICQHLNSSGLYTRHGCVWRQKELKYLLQNPFYIGKIRWNFRPQNCHTPKDESEHIIVDGAHTPIISQEQFDLVQDVLKKRAARVKANTRPSSTKHWLSGLVKCSNCGGTLVMGGHTSNGTRYLRCNSHNKGVCNVAHTITETKIVVGITTALQEMLQGTLPIQYEFKTSTPVIDNSLYESALAKLKLKEKRIKQAYMDGIDSIEEYKENKMLIETERKKLLDKYKKIIPVKVEVDEDKLKEDIKNVIDIINSDAEDKYKYEAIHSVIDYVVYVKAEKRLDVHLVQYE